MLKSTQLPHKSTLRLPNGGQRHATCNVLAHIKQFLPLLLCFNDQIGVKQLVVIYLVELSPCFLHGFWLRDFTFILVNEFIPLLVVFPVEVEVVHKGSTILYDVLLSLKK